MKSKKERLSAFEKIDIYPVISSEFTAERPVLDILKAIADGGAKIVQLREKNKTKAEIFKLAEQYREITDSYQMLLMINDHLDIAMSIGADGVHLGQDDLPVKAAVGLNTGLLIGCSTHNLNEAVAAIADGVDCINIGPIFPTNTKNVSYPAIGIEEMSQIAAQIKIPFTVMGGIKQQHIPELIKAGAIRIAMVTEITMAQDVATQVRHLRTMWHL